jgi:hypothetical protein
MALRREGRAGHAALLARDERGQAVTEYVLLVAIIVAGYALVARRVTESNAMGLLTRPITREYASAYKYGHVKAKGYDEGSPENHPRVLVDGNNNFRIFINPSIGGN